MVKLLKGKVAIVTGAGRGLGRASAIAMAKEGASLVIISRTPSEIRQTGREIRKTGSEVICSTGDIAFMESIKEIVVKTIGRFGKIDILINNAAIVGPVRPFVRINHRDIESILNINLKATMLLSNLILPYMIKHRSGKIINITSGLGKAGMSLFGSYSVTKAAINHYTKILAEELKDYNIQVNAIDPGSMDTKMQTHLRKLGPDVLGKELYNYLKILKEKKLLLAPERVAKLVVFLASKNSDFITGNIGNEKDYVRLGYR